MVCWQSSASECFKNKELCTDFRQNRSNPKPVWIKGKVVDSNLVFYAQSTITVISGGVLRPVNHYGYIRWCFTPSQPLRLYQGESLTELIHMGVIFDNKLCWNKNFSCIIKKANRRSYCLRKLRSLGGSARFAGHLLQCSSVWCSYLWRWSGGEEIFLNMKGEE